MGFIYIIKNTVNNKVYIGQTIHNINIRMNQHLLRADKGSEKLYVAMRDIGKDNFYIELLEEVNNEDLDNKENEYIIKYNSIDAGYNSILNGDSTNHRYSIRKIDEMLDNMISDYLVGMSFTDLSIKYDMSINTVHKFVYDYIGSSNRLVNTNDSTTRFKSNKIVMYDTGFNPICYFESIKDAYIFLCKKSEFKVDKRNTYAYTKRACGCGNIAYGHRWQLVSDLVYEDKIFRTKFDKEAYIQGGQAYQPEGKQYYIVDGALDSLLNKSRLKIKRCSICNKVIDKNAKLCLDCYKEEQRSNIPDIQTLNQLLLEHSYEAIGRMYNVTGKSVKHWCDIYGISEVKRDMSGVTCVELNIHFNTFKEAAEYLIQNGYTSATNISSLGHKISQAKKNNNKYLNLTWK